MAVSKGLDVRACLIFILFFFLYVGLAWAVSGNDTWWVIDYVDGQNIFFGDDAYRFFLARGAWVNSNLYTYNFVLPGQLLLDGAIIRLANGDLFLSRSAHAFAGAAVLVLLYRIGCQLNLPRIVLFSGILIMGLLPRYALMSLSFYGEVWLGLFLVLALFFFLRGSLLAMALTVSCLPLFRPEGIFFLAPIFFYLVLEKKWKELFILVLPGFIYFFYLCFSLPSLTDYMYWRLELRTILSKLDYHISDWKLFSLYSFLFTVPAVLALASPLAKRFWPFLLGGAIWVGSFQLSIIQGMATFENRYSYVLIPFVALLWVIFFTEIYAFGLKWFSGGRMACVRNVLALVSGLLIVGTHFIKTDNVHQAIYHYGYSGWLQKMWQGEWGELYGFHPQETLEARKVFAEKIEAFLSEDEGIDNVSIYTNSLFYYLDPEKIPGHVTVGFLTNGYMVFHMLLGGQSFIQHPGGKMYSYMDYGEPDFRNGERRSLVVTVMPLKDYPYTWKWGDIEMYLFSYLASDHARVDVSGKEKITPEILQKAYEPWYGK